MQRPSRVRGHRKLRFWRTLACWATDVGPALGVRPRRLVPGAAALAAERLGRCTGAIRLPLRITPSALPRVVRPVRERGEQEATAAMQRAADHMQHRMPQFFLRNIGRVERDWHDEPPYTIEDVARATVLPDEVVAVRQVAMRYQPPPMVPEPSYRIVAAALAERRHLFDREDWTRLFGRELRESLPGPLWQHFPDEEAFARYGRADSRRLDLSRADGP